MITLFLGFVYTRTLTFGEHILSLCGTIAPTYVWKIKEHGD